MLKVDLSQWVGKFQTQTACVGVDVARMVHATLARDGSQAPCDGDEMPPLWHWAAFIPKVPMGQLSADGHPKLGGFLPPITLERRMWAGGQLEFHAPVRIGQEMRRFSTIKSIVEKEGAAGPMVFVSVTHEIFADDVLAIGEVQDIVYLQIPRSYMPPKAKPVPEDPTFVERADVTEARLFRYSAVTFNAHRIHYDRDYATEVEKYPGLVVHGPLQATLLMQAAVARKGHAPDGFSFRGVHPMFDFDDLHLFGTQTEFGMRLCTGIPGQHQGMQATITWRD